MDSRYIEQLDDCSRELQIIETHINNDKFNSLNPFLISVKLKRNTQIN